MVFVQLLFPIWQFNGVGDQSKKFAKPVRIGKNWTGGTRANSQSNSRIPDSGPEKCLRKK